MTFTKSNFIILFIFRLSKDISFHLQDKAFTNSDFILRLEDCECVVPYCYQNLKFYFLTNLEPKIFIKF